MKCIKVSVLFFFIHIWFYPCAQSLINFPCYAIAYDVQPNKLYRFDTSMSDWVLIGSTGTNQIEAIATDPVNKILYAFDNETQTLGTLKIEDATFNPIGAPGMANGDYGNIVLNNVKGLSYDVHRNEIFATHRIPGLGVNTNDVLFKLDINNAQVVKNAMTDSFGATSDYSKVQEILDGTFGGDVYDVEDIVYDPFSGGMYAIQNQNGPGVLSYINPVSGQIEMSILDFANDHLSSLAISYFGFLYSSTSLPDLNAPPISYPSSTLNILGRDAFEAFDCFTAVNDLALRVSRSDNTPEVVKPGDLITFDIEIFNQGDIENDKIEINNYIPNGLTLSPSSPNWVVNGNIANYTINTNITPGNSYTIQISFTVNAGYTGTIVNAAEIANSFNSSIVDSNNMPLVLKDVDSNSNNLNEEAQIKDNEILGKGRFVNEDEDDHDIEMVMVGNCLPIQNLNGLLNSGLYIAGNQLNANGAAVSPGETVKFIAGECISLNNFEIQSNADFLAKIGSCGN